MSIRLTQTVQKGGCAAKISAEVLRQVLSEVDFRSTDPDVLIDGRHFDDAGVYRINHETALVQTLDFFTPIVDTPHLFGQIAATNALSDVYAMGGVPKTAMAILAFPLATLDPGVMREVLEGARSKIIEARCSMVGGHSIDDESLKFGLSVTGIVHPGKILSNRTARPGDRLILTKPIGTGTLCAGLKNGDYTENQIREALESMTRLNDLTGLFDEREQISIHAATDITGFGLLGHTLQVARASEVSIVLDSKSLPVFSLTHDSLKAENLTKAHRSNQSYTRAESSLDSALSPEETLTLFDPQTSGGLLLSVAPDHAERMVEKLRARFPRAALIGSVTAAGPSRITVHA
jgi:selenide,water dikinase